MQETNKEKTIEKNDLGMSIFVDVVSDTNSVAFCGYLSEFNDKKILTTWSLEINRETTSLYYNLEN